MSNYSSKKNRQIQIKCLKNFRANSESFFVTQKFPLVPTLLLLILCGFLTTKETLAAEFAKSEDSSLSVIKAEEFSTTEGQKIIKAIGEAELIRKNSTFYADEIEYNQETGDVEAKGNVRLKDSDANQNFLSNKTEFNERERTGKFYNATIIFGDGSSILSPLITRESENHYSMNKTKYSICPSKIDYTKDPSEILKDLKKKRQLFSVHSSEIDVDRNENKLRFKHNVVKFYGVPFFYFPYIKTKIPATAKTTGFERIDYINNDKYGYGLLTPYYIRITEDKSARLIPTFYLEENNHSLEAEYKHRLYDKDNQFLGKYILGGSIANDKHASNDILDTNNKTRAENGRTKDIRGHVAAEGSFKLGDKWTTHFDGKTVFDKNYLRDYQQDYDDHIQSNLNFNRITGRNHIIIKALAFQELDYFRKDDLKAAWELDNTVRVDDSPIALPIIETHHETVPEKILGDRFYGQYMVDSNTTVLSRGEGVQYRRITVEPAAKFAYKKKLGIFNTKLSTRADGYSLEENYSLSKYANGYDNFEGRIIPRATVDWSMPIYKRRKHYTSVVKPMMMFTVTPKGQGDFEENIPNEDSNDTELSDVNIFSENIFPGYDRVDDGYRFSYGVKSKLYNPNLGTLGLSIAQSVRNADEQTGEDFGVRGFQESLSDVVGKVSYKTSEIFDIYYRYRLDGSNFGEKSRELTADFDFEKFSFYTTYIMFEPEFEDETRQEEMKIGGDYILTDKWSVNGYIIQDLEERNATIEKYLQLVYDGGCVKSTLAFKEYDPGDIEKDSQITFNMSIKSDMF